MRSPRLSICSTFCTIMSLTWLSSVCARESSSVGGTVLYSCMSSAMVGENDPCRPYAGKEEKEESEDVEDEEDSSANL